MDFSFIPQDVSEYSVFSYVPLDELQRLSTTSSQYYRMYQERLDDLIRTSGLLDFYTAGFELQQREDQGMEDDYSSDEEIAEITSRLAGVHVDDFVDATRRFEPIQAAFRSDNADLLRDIIRKLVDITGIPIYQLFVLYLVELAVFDLQPNILVFLFDNTSEGIDIFEEKIFQADGGEGDIPLLVFIALVKNYPEILHSILRQGATESFFRHLVEEDSSIVDALDGVDLFRALLAVDNRELAEAFDRYIRRSGVLDVLRTYHYVVDSPLAEMLNLDAETLWNFIPQEFHTSLKAYTLWLYLMNRIDYVPDQVLDDLVATIIDLRYILGDNRPIGAYLETKNLIEDYLDTNPPNSQIMQIQQEYQQLNPGDYANFVQRLNRKR